MQNFDRRSNEIFEDDVRRIARLLWPSAEYSGASISDNKERDGIFETEECIHIIEATTSRRKKKAQDDLKKLRKEAHKHQSKKTKAIKCWFITKDEPTAEQRIVFEKYQPQVVILSFSQFQAKLVDSRAYLSLRDKYYFGSVRDPETGEKNPTVKYLETPLFNKKTSEITPTSDIVNHIIDGAHYVILGDFGAGKSMTLRHIYKDLRKNHLLGDDCRFPVFINLRDHLGQIDPYELLERHARLIGFPNPSHLVRAWRAGYIYLLLDGFDEITTLNIQGLWKKLKDSRYRALESLRRMIREHPMGPGIIVTGREHFFDSDTERKNALGLTGDFIELSLTEFSDKQISEYFKESNIHAIVPSWLPRRPLLVAYLASKGLLAEFQDNEDNCFSDSAAGWDILLTRIANRESQIEAGIDSTTVRRILERLATKARSTSSGLGPLASDRVIEAFEEICGYRPDDRGMVLLQRLPGLGIDINEEETRSFIDEDFVDACRAGDLVDFVNQPYNYEHAFVYSLERSIGELGIDIASIKAKRLNFSSGKFNAALTYSQKLSSNYLISDIVRLTLECGKEIETNQIINDIYIEELNIGNSMLSANKITFSNCYFKTIGIDFDATSINIPFFNSCFISNIEGRVSVRDLPEGKFNERCIIESYSSCAQTTSDVLSLDIPFGTRVALTILKKLYVQRGRGRKENALYRGLDHNARRLVPDIMAIIQSEGLAIPHRGGDMTIWLPDRSKMQRVGKIISAPSTSSDPLIFATKNLD